MPSSTQQCHRSASVGALWVSIVVLVALPSALRASSDLVAFTAAPAARQGSFEAGGVTCSCAGEICRCAAPDDTKLWPAICAALVRESGPVVAFGALGARFDDDQLKRCNLDGVPIVPPAKEAPKTSPTPPAATPPAATPPPRAEAPPTQVNLELCNWHDDDGDGEVDEGVRLTVWEDNDHDLYGDPARSKKICPQELRPGLVVNDYDCDDSDARRNPGRGNCPVKKP